MTCTQFRGFVSKARSNCLQCLGLKQNPKIVKPLSIVGRAATSYPKQRLTIQSSPFNFQHGAPIDFPGFTECDISLLKEKAIASTAVVDDEFEGTNPRSACFELCNLSSIKTMCPVMRATRRCWD